MICSMKEMGSMGRQMSIDESVRLIRETNGAFGDILDGLLARGGADIGDAPSETRTLFFTDPRQVAQLDALCAALTPPIATQKPVATD